MFVTKIYNINLLIRFIVFCTLWFVSFYINYREDSKQTNALRQSGNVHFLAFHHAISTYLLLGAFIFNMPFFYLFSSIGVLLHWIFNNNYCELTVLYNERCKFDRNRLFHDLLWRLKIVGWWERTFSYISLILLNAYIVLRLFNAGTARPHI